MRFGRPERVMLFCSLPPFYIINISPITIMGFSHKGVPCIRDSLGILLYVSMPFHLAYIDCGGSTLDLFKD